jgi:hypothetical protein
VVEEERLGLGVPKRTLASVVRADEVGKRDEFPVVVRAPAREERSTLVRRCARCGGRCQSGTSSTRPQAGSPF